jgi:hypothetical protein
MSVQASDGGQSGSEDFERVLLRALYRFACPDPHTLGEYQLDLLDQMQRREVAAHAAECDECRGELEMLRTFLAAPVDMPESGLARARRIVATLFTAKPGLAYGGLRGVSDAAPQIFEAGDLTVSVGPGQTPGSVSGLLVTAEPRPDVLNGREVRLLPRAGATIATQLDDLGSFEFANLEPGPYVLEIDVPDGVLVIEELRVD